MEEKKLLEVKKLEKNFSNRCVVHDFSLTLGQGEVVGLLGPNGAGKTTAFYMIMGLIRPDSGALFFSGKRSLISRYTIAHVWAWGTLRKSLPFFPI